MESDPDFWSDPDAAAPILKKKKSLESSIKQANDLNETIEDLEAAYELAAEGEEEYQKEAVRLLTGVESLLVELETQSLLGEELDDNDCVITINAGAGGTESCDWAQMLMRMYLRFAEKKGWESEIYDILDGDEAGIKSATIGVSGSFAFGLLKAESGVHRLVRISPFDSNARRHTSFVSIFVSPVVDDDIEVEVNEGDLRIDTYRASGAGGQHVNRTDSAVRITHMPSGIVVQCQNQRSQHQNKAQAMKMLKGKLYERELEERKKAQDNVEAGKASIEWGSQIRSYVLHPYKMVKDHRTNFEHHSPDDVLDGSLGAFIHEFLVSTVKTGADSPG
jgi:peptide chain release factor 2